MSTNATLPSASAPAAEHDLQEVVQTIAAAVPGVVQSLMIVADVLDGSISGVVLDLMEPGGGYVSEQELAPGVVYLVLGVGKVGVDSQPAGVHVANDWLSPSEIVID